MQVVYLNETTEFKDVKIVESKRQNKFGLMYGFETKLDLVTTEQMNDYYVFRSNDNDKWFISLRTDSQIGQALKKISSSLNKEHGFNFKPEKEKVYIRMSGDQASSFPQNSNLLLSVKVYGVFLQHSTNLAFMQCELSDYKASPLVNFNAMLP